MSCAAYDFAKLSRPQEVSVNGKVIERDAIAREVQNHPADKPIRAWQAAAQALVVRELLLQEARRLAITADPLVDEEGRRETEQEALIRQLVAEEVRTPRADEGACRRYYEQNRKRFRSADLYEVRHILFAAAPEDEAARKAAGCQARRAIAQLGRDPSRFAALAEAMSACPSAKNGGRLGQIGPGQTVPEFERALGDLPLGEVASLPIETRYGVHVVLLERRIAGRELPFAVVRDSISKWLNEKVRRTAIAQFIAILAGGACIKGVEIAQARSPLVQ